MGVINDDLLKYRSMAALTDAERARIAAGLADPDSELSRALNKFLLPEGKSAFDVDWAQFLELPSKEHSPRRAVPAYQAEQEQPVWWREPLHQLGTALANVPTKDQVTTLRHAIKRFEQLMMRAGDSVPVSELRPRLAAAADAALELSLDVASQVGVIQPSLTQLCPDPSFYVDFGSAMSASRSGFTGETREQPGPRMEVMFESTSIEEADVVVDAAKRQITVSFVSFSDPAPTVVLTVLVPDDPSAKVRATAAVTEGDLLQARFDDLSSDRYLLLVYAGQESGDE